MKKNFTKQDFYNLLKPGGPNGDCLEWTKGHSEFGYGYTEVNGVSIGCHRLALILEGIDPGNLFVCHTCDNPCCCNPKHLFLGTHKDNNLDKLNKGRHKSGNTPQKGEENGLSKLTDDQVKDIRMLHNQGINGNQLAFKYNVDRTTIYNIIHRRTWKHI